MCLGFVREGVMAPITFHSAHRTEHIARLKPVLTALREGLDAYVSHRIRVAALEAGQICPQRLPGASLPSKQTQ
jgi:hypothetical protein